jgi:predicted Fe-Mo cluster-binding NifX family protein
LNIGKERDIAMGYRIGVASTDGIVVNQHFGRAEEFIIVDVDENGKLYRQENRQVEPICEGGNHDDGKLNHMLNILSDCQYILVSRIGQGAEAALEQKGIKAFEIPGIIEDSVKKLATYIEIQSLFPQ